MRTFSTALAVAALLFVAEGFPSKGGMSAQVRSSLLSKLETLLSEVAAQKTEKQGLIVEPPSTVCDVVSFYENPPFISSENFGEGEYSNNLHCTWVLGSTEPGTVTTLRILAFETEANYDFLSVSDVTFNGTVLLANLSGSMTDLPETTFSASEGSLLVEFITDGSVTRSGFQASVVTGVPMSSKKGAPALSMSSTGKKSPSKEMQTKIGSNNACSGFSLYSDTYIVSDNYPMEYSNNLNCVWVIGSTEPDITTTLTFNAFDTEPENDYVVVYDIVNGHLMPLANLSGSYEDLPSTSFSSENTLIVNFVTDGSVTRSGIHAIQLSVFHPPEYQPIELEYSKGAASSLKSANKKIPNKMGGSQKFQKAKPRQ